MTSITGGISSNYPVKENSPVQQPVRPTENVNTGSTVTQPSVTRPSTTVTTIPSSSELNSDASVISQPGTAVNTDRAEALQGFGGTGMGTHIRSDYSETLSTTASTVLPMDNRTQRMNALEHVSQVDGTDETMFDSERCGPSCIVAGAYYAGGQEGLSQLITDMRAYDSRHQTGTSIDAFIGDLETRLTNGGQVTNGDLNNLQEALHSMLSSEQSVTIDANNDSPEPGLHYSMLSGFIEESPHVKSMFDDNDMAIALVDTDGADGGNHFVLGFQNNGKSTVYDPYPIGTGSTQDQVTQDQAVIERYLNARDSISGSPYIYNGG